MELEQDHLGALRPDVEDRCHRCGGSRWREHTIGRRFIGLICGFCGHTRRAPDDRNGSDAREAFNEDRRRGRNT